MARMRPTRAARRSAAGPGKELRKPGHAVEMDRLGNFGPAGVEEFGCAWSRSLEAGVGRTGARSPAGMQTSAGRSTTGGAVLGVPRLAGLRPGRRGSWAGSVEFGAGGDFGSRKSRKQARCAVIRLQGCNSVLTRPSFA